VVFSTGWDIEYCISNILFSSSVNVLDLHLVVHPLFDCLQIDFKLYTFKVYLISFFFRLQLPATDSPISHLLLSRDIIRNEKVNSTQLNNNLDDEAGLALYESPKPDCLLRYR
jgi:hypothetical protein